MHILETAIQGLTKFDYPVTCTFPSQTDAPNYMYVVATEDSNTEKGPM